jgi:pimeloyl-ACP methyl ester carboxylesterase
LSRSPFDGGPRDTTVETFADDARRLIDAVGGGPAYVMGSSGGALVGLGLISRYPERVRTLVAHEPPLTRLLDDAEEHARFGREIHETYRSEGVGPAMAKFLASADLEGEPPRPPAGPTPEMARSMARMQANLSFFLGHMLLPIGDYAPDISLLRSLPITVAVGEASEGQLAYRAGVALAGRLGKEPQVFPGDHGGFNSHPGPFAERLDEVLGGH